MSIRRIRFDNVWFTVVNDGGFGSERQNSLIKFFKTKNFYFLLLNIETIVSNIRLVQSKVIEVLRLNCCSTTNFERILDAKTKRKTKRTFADRWSSMVIENCKANVCSVRSERGKNPQAKENFREKKLFFVFFCRWGGELMWEEVKVLKKSFSQEPEISQANEKHEFCSFYWTD